jgi:nucleoside-diphosphate-sugar epimerase
MRYLVTGGAGFIGSNIVAELVHLKEDVRVLDDFSSGCHENLESVANRVEIIEGDIRDKGMIAHAMKDVDVVLHQAEIPSVEISVNDPVISSEVNIMGTVNLLESARRMQVSRFVYASTSAVYGDLPDLPKTERSKSKTLSPYAAAKLVGENYCKIYTELFGLETVSLRYFNIFGPNQDPRSEYSAVIPRFVYALISGNKPTVFGDGRQSRDFLHVKNVVDANLLAARIPGIAGRVYNVAGGTNVDLLNLLETLSEILGVSVEPEFQDEKPGDIRHSWADITLSQKELGFSIRVGFREGLEDTITYFKSLAQKPASTS